MKQKTIAVVGRLAAVIAMFLFLFAAEANAQLPDRILSLGSLADNLKTPQSVSLYIWRYFDFEKDRIQFGAEDYWQSAEQLLATKKGDCEDFALFAKEILTRNGYFSFVLNLYGSRDHSICVFKKNGLYGAVDGGNYIEASFDDITSLLTHLDPFWKRGAIVELNDVHRGRILKEILNNKKSSNRFLFWK